MTQEAYRRAGVIMQDLNALNNCGIPSFASEELKKEFSDWIKKKKQYLQNEFDNLQEVNKMIPVNSYVVQRSIEHYGKDVQSTVCMEECAELIQAISKEKRGNSDKDHITEEMADVIICIEMLKQMYNITEDEIYSLVINKQERIIRRIEKDTQFTKTNAERIRNMTDEELAEFLAYNAYCEECYVKKDDSCCYPDGTCKQKHLEWLQSEAEQEKENGRQIFI